jgi:hypothetical protein
LLEAELVREVVSEVTRARFEVVSPPPGFPFPAKNLEWLVRCRKLPDINEVPYVNTVWRETKGPIWLESLALGDSVDWIGLAYGPEMADESLNLDYARMDESEFKAELGKRFPLVLERLEQYSEVAAKESARTKTRLEIRRAGSGGMIVFTLAARMKVGEPSRASLTREVKANIAALSAAYSQILKL